MRDEGGRGAATIGRLAMPGLMLLALTAGFPLAGCNPYMAAVGVVTQTYGVATDERSLATQASDTEIEAKINAGLLDSPVPGTAPLNVWSRRGVVVLAGVVPPGSPAGRAAVAIARATTGVKRVETFFVDLEPSKTADLEIEGKVKGAFIADPNVVGDRVSVGVYAGNVVLVGVVSDYDQAQRFVDDARAVSGVVSVHSYIQTVDQS